MKRWTEAEKQQLESLAGTMKAQQIADIMGRSIQSVRLKALSSGLRLAQYETEHWRPEQHEIEAVLKLYNEGTPIKIISRNLGVEHNQICYVIRNNGGSSRHIKWSDAESAEVAIWYGKVSYRALARAMGRSLPSVKSEMRSQIDGLYGRKSPEWYRENFNSRFTLADFEVTK